MPLEVQKSKLNETINAEKEKSKSIDLSQWEVIERPQQADAPARNAPIPVNIQNSEEVYIEGVREQEAQDVEPKYIGFSEAYIQAEKKDSARMKEIRRNMQEYFRIKDILDQGVGDRLLNLNKAINYLEKLKASCDNYCFFRHSLFSYGSQRKDEVIALRKEAKKELAERRKEYVELADQWTEENAKLDPRLKKRFRPEGKIREVKLGEKNGDLKKLNFDEYTLLDGTEYDAHIEKSYFVNKAKYDLKRSDIKFTEEEKELLNEILSYGENEFSHRIRALSAQRLNHNVEQGVGLKSWPKLSSFLGLVIFSGSHLKNLWRFIRSDKKESNREIESYQKIMPALKKILANPNISEEKKQVFLKYQKRLSSFEDGKLKTEDIPEDKIKDYTNIQRFTLSDAIKESKRKEGGPTTQEDWFLLRSNRKDEPLFVHTPCMSDIVQYSHGNCFALAAIASVVSKDPNAILNMFKDEGEKGVVVKLWHEEPDMSAPEPEKGKERPKKMQPVYYRVDKIVSSFENAGALWVNVLMNAIVAYRQDYPDAWDRNESHSEVKDRVKKQKEAGVKELDFGVVANGGYSAEVFPVLTGREYEGISSYQGSVYESNSTTNILDQVFENTASLEERKKWIETGDILKKDFGTYNLTMRDGMKLHVDHHKDIFDKLTSNLRENYEEVLRKVRVNDDEVIEISKPIGKGFSVFQDIAKQKYKEIYKKEMSEEQLRNLRKMFDFYRHIPFESSDVEACGGEQFVRFVKDSVLYQYELADREQNLDSEIYSAKNKIDKLKKKNLDILKQYYDEKGMTELSDRQKRAGGLSWLLKNGVTDEHEARQVFNKELIEIEGYLTRAGNVIFNTPEIKYKESKKEFMEEHLEKVKKLTINDFPEPEDQEEKEKDIFYRLAKKTGKTRQECFDIAMEQCVRSLEKAIDSYDSMVKSKQLQYFSGVYSDEALEMYNKVKDSLDKGLNVAVGSREGIGTKTGRGESRDIGTVGNHAYSVLGVAEVMFNGRPVKMVKVRNPWAGYTAGYYFNEKTQEVEVKTTVDADSGIFMMELTHFWRTFSNIYTEKAGAAS